MTLGKVLSDISQLVNEHPLLGYRDQYESLAQEYTYMLDYMANGYKDDKREDLYGSMCQRAFSLKEDILQAIDIANNSYFLSLRNKLNVNAAAESNSSASFIERLQNPEVTNEQRFDNLSTAFVSILLSRQWKEQDSRQWIVYILQNDKRVEDACTLVSAIMLACTQWFDFEKLKTLLLVYQMSDIEAVKQRALVGWVSCLAFCDDAYKAMVGELLPSLCDENNSVADDVVQLLMQILVCTHAEADDKKLEKELMPNLSKGQMFQISVDNDKPKIDNLDEFLEQSQSEEAIESMEESLQKIQEMQNNGSDLFFKGFSMMKRFAFFYRLSNWFVPFTPLHPEIQNALNKIGKMKFVDRVFADGPFCDSDKYSFVFSMMHVIDSLPDNVKELMKNGSLAPIGTMEEGDTRKFTAPFIRRNYLQTLYRFYKLYPQYRYKDIFNVERLLRVVLLQLCKHVDVHVDELVSFLLRHGERKYAKIALDIMEPSKKQNSLYATYYFREKDYANAYKCYLKAVELAPEDNRAQLGLARTAFRLGKYDEASATYDSLKTAYPDNLGYALNYVMSEANAGRAEEITNEAYRLDFEYPDNINVKRVLAWVLLMAKKAGQADKMLSAIADGEYGDSNAADFLNAAYGKWFVGNIASAIEWMVKYVGTFRKIEGGESRYTWLKQSILDDSILLKQYGISDTTINLIVDSVRLKIK